MTVVVAVGCWVMLSLVATPIIGVVISRQLRSESRYSKEYSRIAAQIGLRPEPVTIRLAAQGRDATGMEYPSGLLRRYF